MILNSIPTIDGFGVVQVTGDVCITVDGGRIFAPAHATFRQIRQFIFNISPFGGAYPHPQCRCTILVVDEASNLTDEDWDRVLNVRQDLGSNLPPVRGLLDGDQ